MRFADATHLGAWWPVSEHGNAPRLFARALASLSPDAPDAVYCWSTRCDQEEDVFDWHVLAVAGASLIELHGSGPEGRREESALQGGQRVLPSALSVARCHRLRDSVAGIRVLDMRRSTRSHQHPVTDPWDVTWLLELTSGELVTLPEAGSSSPSHIVDAETLAVAVLSHLQRV
jgi:hypothetical protein